MLHYHRTSLIVLRWMLIATVLLAVVKAGDRIRIHGSASTEHPEAFQLQHPGTAQPQVVCTEALWRILRKLKPDLKMVHGEVEIHYLSKITTEANKRENPLTDCLVEATAVQVDKPGSHAIIIEVWNGDEVKTYIHNVDALKALNEKGMHIVVKVIPSPETFWQFVNYSIPITVPLPAKPNAIYKVLNKAGVEGSMLSLLEAAGEVLDPYMRYSKNKELLIFSKTTALRINREQSPTGVELKIMTGFMNYCRNIFLSSRTSTSGASKYFDGDDTKKVEKLTNRFEETLYAVQLRVMTDYWADPYGWKVIIIFGNDSHKTFLVNASSMRCTKSKTKRLEYIICDLLADKFERKGNDADVTNALYWHN